MGIKDGCLIFITLFNIKLINICSCEWFLDWSSFYKD